MQIRATLAILALTLFFGAAAQSAGPIRPNVLLILADDLGWADLGYQGSKDIRSPNIDRLAATGVRFTDGHTSASVCSPSRAGLLTGRYQQRFGHEANSPPPKFGMDVDETTIADRFRRLGYRTGIVGKWHLGVAEEHYPTRRGFDYFYGLRQGSRGYFFDARKDDKPNGLRRMEQNGKHVSFDGYLTDVLGEQAIDFIGDSEASPFFLFLSFTAPHGPMHATEADKQRFAHIEDPRRRTYAAMIWAMDRAIGRVLQHLENTGREQDTLVWFLSDNGGATNNGSINLPLAGHKGIKFEGGIRVPFLLKWPRKFAQPSSFDKLVSALDILPTSIAAAGGEVAATDNVDGVNLLPYVDGSYEAAPHQKLYWHKLWFSAMRDGPWKLIYVQDYGYALYNLDQDLGEAKNLLAANPQRAETMKRDLDQWKQTLVEPLWREGDVWFRTHTKNHVRIIEAKE